MRFTTLNETIPYISEGKLYSHRIEPYKNVILKMPGRHADQTTPAGGDFAVCVTDQAVQWDEKKFTHSDIFADVEARKAGSDLKVDDILYAYYQIVNGEDPEQYRAYFTSSGEPSVIPTMTFLYAVQCLAVAEHRRYSKHEVKFGGRYLPFRFTCGIVEGKWTANDASARQKMGRPGVEWLEKEFGMPTLTKELMNG